MRRRFYVIGLAVSAAVAGGLSLFASGDPDGLERVAIDLGFIETAEDSAVSGSALADYTVAGSEGQFAAVVAGLAGVVAVALAGYLLYLWLRAPRQRDGQA